MADLPRHPDAGNDTGPGADLDPVAPTARWKSVAIGSLIVLVLVVVVVLHLTGVLGAEAHQ